MGSVYVFNATPQRVRLSVENQWLSFPIQQIAGPPYVPKSVTIARSDSMTGSIVFVNGTENAVVVQTQQGQSNPVELNIPATSASSVDLWLYVYWQVVQLFDTSGAMIDWQMLTWSS